MSQELSNRLIKISGLKPTSGKMFSAKDAYDLCPVGTMIRKSHTVYTAEFKDRDARRPSILWTTYRKVGKTPLEAMLELLIRLYDKNIITKEK